MLILMEFGLTRTCSAVAWLYTMLPSSLNFCAFEKMRSTSAAQALDVLYSCRFILDYEKVRNAPSARYVTDQDLFETNRLGDDRIVRRIAFFIRKLHEVECELCATALHVRFCSLVMYMSTNSGSVDCVNLIVVSVIRASKAP